MLAGHLEKEQERELLGIALVRKPVVVQDVAVGPELLDDAVRGVAHAVSVTERGSSALAEASSTSVEIGLPWSP
ncbi:hypothetical protein KJ059_11960 [Myxococcota bacterium]|nr:hypothetical protein [Myxococcota bacterium]